MPATVALGVADDATAANSQPKLAHDHLGNIHLVFVRAADGANQIFWARSRDSGRRWEAFRVSRGGGGSRYPSLAIDPQGDPHVAWTAYDGGAGQVFYTRFTGRRWTEPLHLSAGQTYAGVPALAVDPAGRAHVVWYGIRPEAPVVRTRHGSIYEILYTRQEGRGWTSPVVISRGIPDAINPTLASDARGVLHSAWYQFNLRTYQVLYTRRDHKWSAPLPISTRTHDTFAVAMAVGTNADLHVVWERRGADQRIYAAHYRQRWSVPAPISPPGMTGHNPSVAVDRRGTVYVVWESEGALYIRSRRETWGLVGRVTTEGVASYPILSSTATWLKIKDRTGKKTAAPVDLMWTERAGDGTRRVRFLTVARP